MSMLLNPSRFGAAAPITPLVTMATATGTSVTPPAHTAGDILVAFPYRDGNNNAPGAGSVPAGWTAITATGLVGSGSQAVLVAYKVAGGSSETCTGFTNATGIICAVVKKAGAGPMSIGNNSGVDYSGVGTTLAAAGFSLANSDGHSVILFFGGHRNTNNDSTISPSGFTHDVGSANCWGIATGGGYHSTAPVSSFAGCSTTWGGSSGNCASFALEIVGAA